MKTFTLDYSTANIYGHSRFFPVLDLMAETGNGINTIGLQKFTNHIFSGIRMSPNLNERGLDINEQIYKFHLSIGHLAINPDLDVRIAAKIAKELGCHYLDLGLSINYEKRTFIFYADKWFSGTYELLDDCIVVKYEI